jgi:GAF domain-containing protein
MLNLYQTVSSALSYIGDLEELLRTIMSIVTTELLCEEGSVILYQECQHEFQFFAVAGESEKDLIRICFSADQGIAGRALRESMPFIENDVRKCPFFYGDIDQLHGYETRSVLAVPLTLMDETIGVIEAINKFEDMHFTKEDQQTLVAIADEVALAIRNAKLFEIVVECYCSRRQGELNCRGCKRPFKSWTPCPIHLHEQSAL